jgi:hypothetical protein
MTTKWLLLLFCIGILSCAAFARAGVDSTSYSIELIRGTDDNKPPEPKSKLLSTNEIGCFRSVFKWKYYWQMNAERIEIVPGRVTRVRLNPEREVEIDLTRAEQRAVKAFYQGKLMQCAICPRGEARTLIGGDRDSNSAWFIVISRTH